MTKPIASKKEVSKAAPTKRALIQLRVTGFGDSKFPSATNLETAVQNRAQALGYNEVGTVSIDSTSTDALKLINIAANDIEPVRLVGILDDVLRNFLNAGYVVEFVQSAGPVRTEMKFVRMTKKQYKASKAAEVAKSAAKSDVKPTKKAGKSAIRLLGRRSGACRKIAREYAKRQLAAAPEQSRSYLASGSNWAKPDLEAMLIANYLFAAYSIDAEATGNKVTITASSSESLESYDQMISSIQVARAVGLKNDANTAVVSAWLSEHPGIYVDTTTDPNAYFFIGPEVIIDQLPKLER